MNATNLNLIMFLFLTSACYQEGATKLQKPAPKTAVQKPVSALAPSEETDKNASENLPSSEPVIPQEDNQGSAEAAEIKKEDDLTEDFFLVMNDQDFKAEFGEIEGLNLAGDMWRGGRAISPLDAMNLSKKIIRLQAGMNSPVKPGALPIRGKFHPASEVRRAIDFSQGRLEGKSPSELAGIFGTKFDGNLWFVQRRGTTLGSVYSVDGTGRITPHMSPR
ncbi:MAG: hypothetical protein HYW48_06060 [Deltaproteobacteria bacterium]|nr:hypothetical protein [Deltaproteobacteria bacterium]